MIEPQLAEPPASISDKALRQFAGLWLVIVGGVACWQGYWWANVFLSLVLAGLAIAFGVLGLVKPPAIRPLFVTLVTLTSPIGWVVSHVVLALLFYGVFTPLGLVFRLTGRDALARRRRPHRETYWTPKPATPDLSSYLRQS